MHSKKKPCRDAHPVAYARFKQLWTAARGAVVEAEKTAREERAAAAAAVTSAGGVADLWERCRGDRRLAAYLQEIEQRLRGLHDLDAEDEEDAVPFVFDPVAGFESVIAEAMSGQKTVRLTERKMTEMTAAHDRELTEHRRIIADQQRAIELQGGRLIELTEEKRALGREVTDLQETVTGQQKRLEEFEETVTGQQKRLEEFEETVTAQKAQLEEVEELKGVVAEHDIRIKEHDANLQVMSAEMTSLRETVTEQATKMQDMRAEIRALRAELASFSARSMHN